MRDRELREATARIHRLIVSFRAPERDRIATAVSGQPRFRASLTRFPAEIQRDTRQSVLASRLPLKPIRCDHVNRPSESLSGANPLEGACAHAAPPWCSASPAAPACRAMRAAPPGDFGGSNAGTDVDAGARPPNAGQHRLRRRDRTTRAGAGQHRTRRRSRRGGSSGSRTRPAAASPTSTPPRWW